MSAVAAFWREVKGLIRSWLLAFRADGDGPPNWLWPSVQTGTVVGAVLVGLYFAADRAAFVLAIIVPFSTFCGVTFVAWLSYRGWRSVRARPDRKDP